MNFFIIYTPNTAKLLSLLIQSLLEHSKCTFCIVANGCLEEEKQILRNLCSKEIRLSFFELPTNTMWKHGRALNLLYTINQSRYFCFMDSDIFATGPFMPQIKTAISNHTGMFSCSALWMPEENKVLPSNYPRVSGRYNTTKDGICLGNTYFAVYDCQKIEALSSKILLDFSRLKWNNIPPQYQKILIELGLKKIEYDTCKVFNLLLHHHGKKLSFFENNHLIHIGGVSAKTARNGILFNKRLAKFLFLLPEGSIKQKLLKLAALPPRKISILFSEMGNYDAKRKVRKAMVTKYFSELLEHLLYTTKRPKLPKFINKQVQKNVEVSSQKLSLFFAKYLN